MNLTNWIGRKKIFARARMCTRSIATVFCIVFSAFAATTSDPAFIRGANGSIRGLFLDRLSEISTRKKMKILDNCVRVKSAPTAMAFVGAENAAVLPHMTAKQGAIELEALMADGGTKILDTELLGPYKNYPTSMIGETILPSPHHPLAVTLAAPFAGEQDLVIQKNDYLGIRTDGLVYAYHLPPMIIPSGGLLRMYLGTDDTLYYDAALTHPVHEGFCKKRAK
jgi:hypothetical protein